jgi:hypothetical protein
MLISTLRASDGSTIVAWGTYGSVRGYGPLRATREQAEGDLRADVSGCHRQHGYSDRQVVAVDADGVCWAVDYDGDAPIVLHWVRGPGGGRAAHYSHAEMAIASGGAS